LRFSDPNIQFFVFDSGDDPTSHPYGGKGLSPFCLKWKEAISYSTYYFVAFNNGYLVILFKKFK
jgi:hypothetical protein